MREYITPLIVTAVIAVLVFVIVEWVTRPGYEMTIFDERYDYCMTVHEDREYCLAYAQGMK